MTCMYAFNVCVIEPWYVQSTLSIQDCKSLFHYNKWISLILSFQESLFLSETLEKITFNPGLWGKLLLILENELETSPSSSPTFSELQHQQQPGTLCWLGVGGPDFERVDQD